MQMVSVHQLAMEFLRRSTQVFDHPLQLESYVNAANKLLRTYTTQMEALNRHRGKVAPSMVVGNVNVNEGGQAVVGPVNGGSSQKLPVEDDAKIH